jgi:hypothetical protein
MKEPNRYEAGVNHRHTSITEVVADLDKYLSCPAM